jgi:hypothetical protein
MTDKQTEVRPLSAYPVGSRWRDERGRELMMLPSCSTPLPLRYVSLSTNSINAASLSEAATWTPLDPAPAQTDALREAAERLVRALEGVPLDTRAIGAWRAVCDALAQPAPEPVASEPPLTFRDRAALAALPWALQCAFDGMHPNYQARYAVAVRHACEAADAFIAAKEPTQ